jgi:hypothetical protein
MRESELLEGNRFVRGIKKIHDRLFAMVRLYDQLTPAHVTLAVVLSLDLSRHRKACLILLSRLWGSCCDRMALFYPTMHGAHKTRSPSACGFCRADLLYRARRSRVARRPARSRPREAPVDGALFVRVDRKPRLCGAGKIRLRPSDSDVRSGAHRIDLDRAVRPRRYTDV